MSYRVVGQSSEDSHCAKPNEAAPTDAAEAGRKDPAKHGLRAGSGAPAAELPIGMGRGAGGSARSSSQEASAPAEPLTGAAPRKRAKCMRCGASSTDSTDPFAPFRALSVISLTGSLQPHVYSSESVCTTLHGFMKRVNQSPYTNTLVSCPRSGSKIRRHHSMRHLPIALIP